MSEPNSVRRIRIFISSPGDVKEERKLLESIIRDELQTSIGNEHGLFLEPILWEKLARPGLGDIQANVAEQLGEYDIFVGIFWNRFGTPTLRYESGSEEEFYDAYQKWMTDTSRPVMMYFSERPDKTDLTKMDPDAMIERAQQMKRLKQFRTNIEEKGLHWTYKDLEAFRQQVTRHLRGAILSLVPDAPTLVSPPPPPRSGSGSTRTDRIRYLKALRRDCLNIPLTAMGESETDQRAVTLEQVFIRLNVRHHREAHTSKANPGMDLTDEAVHVPALTAIKNVPQCVILGAPGSGKSSLVKHLLAQMGACEVDGGESLLPGTEGLLPVLIVLRDLAPKLDIQHLSVRQKDRQQALAKQVVEQAEAQAKLIGAEAFVDGIKEAFLDEKVFLVLDGLDEVPYDRRKLVREAVGAVFSQYHVPRLIITCRIRSYSGETVFTNVPTFTLSSLTEEQVEAFVDQWYAAQVDLRRIKEHERKSKASNLKEVATREPLLSLAQNPMLLTTMTIIHQQHARLPEERVKLYKLAVDLLLRRWQQEHAGLPDVLHTFLTSDEKVRPAMERLAYEAHKAKGTDQAADLDRHQAIKLLSDPLYLGHEGRAADFLDYVDLRSGLLVGRGGTRERPLVYSFPHRTFQEYLAGCHILGARGAKDRLKRLSEQGDFWNETVRLGIEEQVYHGASAGRNQLLNLASLLSQHPPITEAESRQALWAARMAEVVGADIVEQDPGDLEEGYMLLNRLRTQCIELFSSPLPAVERAEAGRIVAGLGDPRTELLMLEDMRFCFVPTGPFVMGSTTNALELGPETPQSLIDIPWGYWIGESLVTQGHYAAFIKAGGYTDRRWWTTSGWSFIQEWNEPERYSRSFELPNHPMVGVSWYEASAFTRWLTDVAHQKGWLPREREMLLPNEAEWEKAARGGLLLPDHVVTLPLKKLRAAPSGKLVKKNELPDRTYAWGEERSPDHCNNDQSGINTTSTPGCFPKGRSLYDCYDMNGNVWEWMRNKSFPPFPYPIDDLSWEEVEGSGSRVLRGGSFDLLNQDVRCAIRLNLGPDGRGNSIGFRLVAPLR